MSESLETNGHEVPAVSDLRQDVAAKARALAASAIELEQASLFDEAPFEEAFCLSLEEVRKRYTSENARHIEWRRHACVQLLARQCPTPEICVILKMNHRTVSAIAAQESQAVSTFSEQYAQTLAASALSDIALAQTKRETASYKDLHIGAGIKMTHAANFKMIGAGGAEETALELETENPALTKAREWLKRKAATLKPEMA